MQIQACCFKANRTAHITLRRVTEYVFYFVKYSEYRKLIEIEVVALEDRLYVYLFCAVYQKLATVFEKLGEG